MKSMRRGIAFLMAVLLTLTPLQVAAETTTGDTAAGEQVEVSVNEMPASVDDATKTTEGAGAAELVIYNTYNHEYKVGTAAVPDKDYAFAGDGSYTIQIPESDPFFPYEVQFKYNGQTVNEWFMNPSDSVQIGGHTFYVNANFSGEVLTQMTLNVAGSTVIAYPEKKSFTHDDVELELESLLPLEDSYISIDLSDYTPMDLKKVSITGMFAGKVSLNASDKVAWELGGYTSKEYIVSNADGYFDLSYPALYGNSSESGYLIIGADQLKPDAAKYWVNLSYTKADDDKWLVPTVYLQTSDGRRIKADLSYISDGAYKRYGGICSSIYKYIYVKNTDEISNVLNEDSGAVFYGGFSISDTFAGKGKYAKMRAYSGRYSTPEEAVKGADITDQVFAADMTSLNSGIKKGEGFTLVSFDANNNPLASLIVNINNISIPPSTSSTSTPSSSFSLDLYDSQGINTVASGDSINFYENTISSSYASFTLDKTSSVDAAYNLKLSGDTVSAIYQGTYYSEEEALEENAENLLSTFTAGGYQSVYKDAVYFTAISKDGEVTIFYVYVTQNLSSSCNIDFYGFKDDAGNIINSIHLPNKEDNYGDRSYETFLVDSNVDVTKLKMLFEAPDTARVYTNEQSGDSDKSGVTSHDFSNVVQYTVMAENGKNFSNHWIIVKKLQDDALLHISSLFDPISETTVKDGIVYSKREILLESLSSYHDILVANLGKADIPSISVELNSDVLQLDEYWNYQGQYSLQGVTSDKFDTIVEGTYSNGNVSYTKTSGKAANLSKLRLHVKDGVDSGTEVTGTLIIKSAGKVLMELTLVGQVGAPTITTTGIPESVKYVPYGAVVQNNNKYSRNQVSYELYSGTLPEGMVVKPNGEIYGVPKETGTFNITIELTSSLFSGSSSRRTFDLVVKENTDTNVDAETDSGYDLRERIQYNLDTASMEPDYLMVSEGTYDQFKYVFLDGDLLTPGTDYISGSGSTRITITSQTLASKGDGTHTIGVEFRTQDGNDTLHKAAQNYVINGTDKQVPTEPTGNPADANANNNADANTNINANANVNASNAVNVSNSAAIYTTYTIQPGDTLWKIAAKFYGNGALWNKIYADNKAIIKNPNKIFVGQTIKVYLNLVSNQNIVAGGTYTVKAGDSLYKIAKAYYGSGKKWKKILEANSSTIKDPQKIYVGQVIVIPKD